MPICAPHKNQLKTRTHAHKKPQTGQKYPTMFYRCTVIMSRLAGTVVIEMVFNKRPAMTCTFPPLNTHNQIQIRATKPKPHQFTLHLMKHNTLTADWLQPTSIEHSVSRQQGAVILTCSVVADVFSVLRGVSVFAVCRFCSFFRSISAFRTSRIQIKKSHLGDVTATTDMACAMSLGFYQPSWCTTWLKTVSVTAQQHYTVVLLNFHTLNLRKDKCRLSSLHSSYDYSAWPTS